MSDLKHIFERATTLTVPDLRDDIDRRAATATSRAFVARDGSGHGRRRVAAIVVSVGVSVAAGALLWQALPTGSDGRRPGGSAIPSSGWVDLESGFNPVPAPPAARGGQVVEWTGDLLLAWGGEVNDGGEYFDDGFGYDPSSRAWTTLPSSPLSARSHAVSVWTGHELLIWGGTDGEGIFLGDGAAYDPVAGAWRTISSSPLDPRAALGAVWTGNEMIVWGSSELMPSAREDATGAAYDPASDSWRPIAEGLFPVNRGSVAWTGTEMIVLGAYVEGSSNPKAPGTIGAAYDPVRDSWRPLPELDLDPSGTFAVWTEAGLFALDYNHQARMYDVVTDEWRDLPSLPLDDGESWPSLAGVPDAVFVRSFGGPAVFHPASERWETDLTEEDVGFPIAAGDAVVLWPGESSESSRMLVWKR
jgi:hypothetical protein